MTRPRSMYVLAEKSAGPRRRRMACTVYGPAVKLGDWLDETALFSMLEAVGSQRRQIDGV